MTRPSYGRREFVKLAGLAGAVFASALPGASRALQADDFFFVQLSDAHWGFAGPPNPDARGTLPKAIAAVNSLTRQPDFVVFTGDLTHSTDDPAERRTRMREVKQLVGELRVKTLHFMPGEHDAALDDGLAFREIFGPTHYTFDHRGVHFIVLDNVSDPHAAIGEAQLAWLEADLKRQRSDAPIVVFTHRPLFDLYPQWDWATRDGAQAIALLMPHPNVTVFYGHIHQEHHHMTGHIAHHAAKSLIFALPQPGAAPKRLPLPWDPAAPYRGLGFRGVDVRDAPPAETLTEYPVQGQG
ncbi:MAG: metallophosphoesterase [Betaproteobacteria bacterium]|nr:metallophosphoesterase [Betaproteobacteria bacterium]